MFRPSPVRQWFTNRTIMVNCIDIYMLMISNSAEYSSFSKRKSPKVPLMICISQTVRLVNHCFMTCTTHKTLFHDLYEWFSKGRDLLYFLRV